MLGQRDGEKQIKILCKAIRLEKKIPARDKCKKILPTNVEKNSCEADGVGKKSCKQYKSVVQTSVGG